MTGPACRLGADVRLGSSERGARGARGPAAGGRFVRRGLAGPSSERPAVPRPPQREVAFLLLHFLARISCGSVSGFRILLRGDVSLSEFAIHE